jgi:PAS domain S-box-containing protein
MAAPDDKLPGLDLPEPREPAPARRWVGWSLLGLLLLAGVAGGIVKLLIDGRRDDLHAAQSARMEALASGRAEVLATWLEGVARLGRRLADSDAVRLFTTEMALRQPGDALSEALADQLPYFRQLILDFAEQNDLAAATLFGLDGQPFLSSAPQAPEPPGAALEAIDGTVNPVFGPIRMATPDPTGQTSPGSRLALDVLLPIPVVQTLEEEDAGPPLAGALSMSVAVADRLRGFLELAPASGDGMRFRLVQQAVDGQEEVLPAGDRLARFAKLEGFVPGRALDYAEVVGFDGNSLLLVGAPVPGLPWTLLLEADAELVRAPLRAFAWLAAGVAGLLALALALGFIAFWWRRSDAHHRDMARQYQELAGRIQHQRRLLQNITDAVHEMLWLKDRDDRYAYANPAFARALGRPVEQILGKTDQELLPAEEARRLAAGDERVLRGHPVITRSDEVTLAGRRYHLALSKMPLRDDQDRIAGIVGIARDETELIDQRRDRERAVRQMVDALIRAIELRDPFLVGHTRRLRGYALDVGRRLDLSERDLTTLDLAASLCQIGKIFVPDEILTKPDRHTEAEAAVMRSHVTHALEVLGPIDFDLPVDRVVGEMYERLDGSGYPRGLPSEQIGLLARILGAVDVFCALTAPRSYRDKIAPEKALEHLATHAHLFDIVVTSVLADVIAFEAGRGGSEPGAANANPLLVEASSPAMYSPLDPWPDAAA